MKPRSVNTAKVAGRRELRFATVDEALRDAAQLAAAERAGSLERLGNWSLGQAFGHVAEWIRFSYDGSPFTPPWILRTLGPWMKRFVLARPMPRGIRLRGVAEGTYGTAPMSTDEGLARLRREFDRLGRNAPSKPSPVFGAMTHEEWLQLHLGHAALHQGFFRAKP